MSMTLPGVTLSMARLYRLYRRSLYRASLRRAEKVWGRVEAADADNVGPMMVWLVQ